jgi:hypothetical protein
MNFLHRIRDSTQLVDAFNVDPVYLKHANQGKVPDYRVKHTLLFNEMNDNLHADIMSK